MLTPEQQKLVDEATAKYLTPKQDQQQLIERATQKYLRPSTPTPPIEPKKPGLVQSIAQDIARPFLKTGLTLAQPISVAQKMIGEKKGLVQAVREVQDVPTDFGYFGQQTPIQSPQQLIGTGLELGSNVLAGVPKGTSLLGKVGLGVAMGSSYGAGSALSEDEAPLDVAKSTAVGGITGGAVNLIGAGLGAAKRKFLDPLAEQMYNTAVKPTLDELRKALKYGTPTLGKELLKEGISGSPRKLLEIADDKLVSTENKLQALLKNTKGTIRKDDLSKYFDKAVEDLAMTPGASNEFDVIYQVLNDMPQKVSVQEANVLKRNIYQKLRDISYKLDPSLSPKKQAMKTLAGGLKKEIEKIGGSEVAKLNRQLSIFGRLEDRVVDTLARSSRNNLLGLSDIMLGAAGGQQAGLPLIALRHILGSTSFKTKAANVLTRLGEGTIGKTTKGITKKGILSEVQKKAKKD